MDIKNKKNKNIFFHGYQAGVTLIEMIVVVGIIAMISSVLIFNYSDFSSNVSLRNLSQDIALSIRKAQTFATSVRALDGSSTTYPAYGISFAVEPQFTTGNQNTIPRAKQFVLFADQLDVNTGRPNGIYEPGDDCDYPLPGSECYETFSIMTSDYVTRICAIVNGADICTKDGVIDITYRRPSPDANICYRETPSSSCQNASSAQIWVRSVKGLERNVTVFNTGQISVQ